MCVARASQPCPLLGWQNVREHAHVLLMFAYIKGPLLVLTSVSQYCHFIHSVLQRTLGPCDAYVIQIIPLSVVESHLRLFVLNIYAVVGCSMLCRGLR